MYISAYTKEGKELKALSNKECLFYIILEFLSLIAFLLSTAVSVWLLIAGLHICRNIFLFLTKVFPLVALSISVSLMIFFSGKKISSSWYLLIRTKSGTFMIKAGSLSFKISRFNQRMKF